MVVRVSIMGTALSAIAYHGAVHESVYTRGIIAAAPCHVRSATLGETIVQLDSPSVRARATIWCIHIHCCGCTTRSTARTAWMRFPMMNEIRGMRFVRSMKRNGSRIHESGAPLFDRYCLE